MKLNSQVIIQILILVVVMLVLLLLLDINQVDGYYTSHYSRRYNNNRMIVLILVLCIVWRVLPWSMDKFTSTTSQINSFGQKKSSAASPPEAPLDVTLDTQLQSPDNDYQFTDVQKSDNNTYVLNYKQKTSSKKVQFKAVDSNKNNVLEPTEIIDCRVIDKKP